jgi:site-specific DNA-methyltransferase (adenine-specific)
MDYRILAGDCIARMQMMDKHSVDDIITDPPYEINFMNSGWDNSGVAFNPATWKEAHRVLKPNGMLVVFGATRTHHRIAHAIERAGFEIIEIIGWTYSTGFPKSHNISKGIDKKLGHKPKLVGRNPNSRENSDTTNTLFESGTVGKTAYITAPTSKDAEKWDGWGTALKPAWEPIIIARKKGSKRIVKNISKRIHLPKANKKERNRGLEDFEEKECGKNQSSLEGGKMLTGSGNERSNLKKNNHPTVKPVKLMKILVEEYSEKGGTVFDPFVGSGTTGMACVLADRNFIGCELTEDYLPLIKARIDAVIADKEGWI